MEAEPEGARTTTTGQLHELEPLEAKQNVRFGLPGRPRTHAVHIRPAQSKKRGSLWVKKGLMEAEPEGARTTTTGQLHEL